MIANLKRLPTNFIGFFAVQFAIAKYPYVFAGETIPVSGFELMQMTVMSVIGALLIENLIWRVQSLRSGNPQMDGSDGWDGSE